MARRLSFLARAPFFMAIVSERVFPMLFWLEIIAGGALFGIINGALVRLFAQGKSTQQNPWTRE